MTADELGHNIDQAAGALVFVVCAVALLVWVVVGVIAILGGRKS